MKSSTTLQLMLAVSGVSAVFIPVHNREASSNVARGPLEATDNYVRLSKSAKYPHLESLVRRASSEKGLVSLAANPSYPVAEVRFAGETIPMLIDTGSSDIWVVKKGFKCVEKDGTETKAADCYIPKPFDHTPTGGYVKGANLSITYGDESFVLGPMALEDVTIGGIKVPSQQIGIADIVSTGAGGRDSSYSGLMGVSYSYLTSQVDAVTGKAAGEYTSIMTNMVEKKLATSFAMALDRGVDKGGYMAFGGLPPVETISDWVSTPILKKNVTDEHNKTSAQYTGYFAKVNRIVLRHGSDGSIPTNYNVTNDFKWSDPVRVLVDSGTALTTLPMHLVSHIMTAYDPPARLRVVEDDPDSFYVVCNAKPPFLGAQFNNEAGSGVMWIDDNDLILQDTKAKVNGKDYCLTGIQATDGTPILGDTWMHNVVAVFDVGNSTMHFAQRPQY